MRTKGLTLIELGIAMSILMTILVVVGSIFSVSIRTYQSESQRSTFQRELNFVTDLIARDIKQSQSVQNYNSTTPPITHTLTSTKIALQLPSLDNDNNFIYQGGIPLTDTVVYYKTGGNLYRVVYPNPASRRASAIDSGNPKVILKDNVSALNFTYSPNINAARQIDFTLTLSKIVGSKAITISSKNVANLRNK